MHTITLVSLNIERHKHVERVASFLSACKPDVVCLQEILEEHIQEFAGAMGATEHTFAPMCLRPQESSSVMGVAILSRLSIKRKTAEYYVGDPSHLPESFLGRVETYNNMNRALLVCDVEKEGTPFRIATTHFTWTPDGSASDLQREHMAALLKKLEAAGELVFSGDFNAPRGGEMFSTLAAKYKDNVPHLYTSSIDPVLHRAGPLSLMVDGLFSTPAYTVSDVRMECGVSDHCALVATVSKAAE